MNAQKWATAIAVIICLPIISMPWLIAQCQPDSFNEKLLWAYPFAVICGAYCAWKSMPDRPEVFWILIAVIALTHAAVWLL